MEDILELMRTRHSVRSYTSEPLSAQEVGALQAAVERCNRESGLHIRLVCDEPKAFDSFMAHYGKFTGVRNYLVLAGPAALDLQERCGYWGEELVLAAHRMGLGTCWVALTFSKRAVKKMLAKGDKLAVVIALGHGTTCGVARKSKEPQAVSNAGADAPAWFSRGVEAALLAPTAMNQQSFFFTLGGTEDAPTVKAESKGGFYSNVDLGIVKHDFEAAAGTETFTWA